MYSQTNGLTHCPTYTFNDRFKGLSKTKTIPKKTLEAIKKRFEGRVTVPIVFNPDIEKIVCTYRGPTEDVLPEAKASFMEQPNWYEVVKGEILKRFGGKSETYVDVCVRCLGHEAWNDINNFKKIAPEVLLPLTAFSYSYKNMKKEQREISGVFFEQTMKLDYNSNEEIARIDLVTLEEFKQILYSQIDALIDPVPPGPREDLRWITDELLNLSAINERSWNLGPYGVSVKSFKKRRAKNVYAMPPSRNLDPLNSVMRYLYKN